jgi:hypothetical protein
VIRPILRDLSAGRNLRRQPARPKPLSGKEKMSVMPSVKGSVLKLDVEAVLKLVSGGKISRDDLQRRLQPEDLEVLDHPVRLIAWYDIRITTRLLHLLLDIEGKGNTDYLLRHGANAAQRLLQGGLYQQLEYLKRMQLGGQNSAHTRYLLFGRDLRLLTTLSASIYNFGRWQAKPDSEHEDRYIIEVLEASAFPDALCWTTEGFINRMADRHGDPDLWHWTRVRPDRIVYRMTRSLER